MGIQNDWLSRPLALFLLMWKRQYCYGMEIFFPYLSHHLCLAFLFCNDVYGRFCIEEPVGLFDGGLGTLIV
jgi:hypothetical protein